MDWREKIEGEIDLILLQSQIKNNSTFKTKIKS